MTLSCNQVRQDAPKREEDQLDQDPLSLGQGRGLPKFPEQGKGRKNWRAHITLSHGCAPPSLNVLRCISYPPCRFIACSCHWSRRARLDVNRACRRRGVREDWWREIERYTRKKRPREEQAGRLANCKEISCHLVYLHRTQGPHKALSITYLFTLLQQIRLLINPFH